MNGRVDMVHFWNTGEVYAYISIPDKWSRRVCYETSPKGGYRVTDLQALLGGVHDQTQFKAWAMRRRRIERKLVSCIEFRKWLAVHHSNGVAW